MAVHGSPEMPESSKRLGQLTPEGRSRLRRYCWEATWSWFFVPVFVAIPLVAMGGGGFVLTQTRRGASFLPLGIVLLAIGLGLLWLLLTPTKATVSRTLAIYRAAIGGQGLFISGILKAAGPARGIHVHVHPQMQYLVSDAWCPVFVDGVGHQVSEVRNHRLGQRIVMEVVPERPELLLSMNFPDTAPAGHQVGGMRDEDWVRFDERRQQDSIAGPMFFISLLPLGLVAVALDGLSSFLTFAFVAFLGVGGAGYFMSDHRKKFHRRGVEKLVVDGEVDEVVYGKITGEHRRSVWMCRVGGEPHSMSHQMKLTEGLPEWFHDTGRVRIEYAVRGRRRWFLQLIRLGSEGRVLCERGKSLVDGVT